ncbi:cyclic AMP response element-binding protein B [Culicoides brevitarsis]|uniref:cyclic AMP response element-binding protein B n=1 Tax=Culicoides brevitarsis TaxID=469753 RepID=UPI00307B6CBD
MTSIVEENGSSAIDNLAPPESMGAPGQNNNNNNNNHSPHPHLPPPQALHAAQQGHSPVPSSAVLAASANIVQIIPTQHQQQTSSHQTHSVIQPNQQSVIQAAGNLQSMTLPKSVLLVSKPNSVIHTTTQGALQAIQIKQEQSMAGNMMHDTNSDDDSMTDDESPKKRRDLLVRRPSYRKILNELGSAEMSAGTLMQYTQGQDGQAIFVPVNIGNNTGVPEDQSRAKREMRLQKNREAARECRRKKKEYIKCLENRVAVLENQNKALIDELKSLKELYCQSKSE